MGDTVACAGLATDSIQGGAFPVSIEGNPAARMSGKTAHGGQEHDWKPGDPLS
jgi:uncharacterized Zn-binding protein involved in type VI secretion